MIVNEDSVVYGVAFDSSFSGVHTEVNTIKSVDRLSGSKYVQNTINGSYKNVKKNLNENKTVLFSGTPCQV